MSSSTQQLLLPKAEGRARVDTAHRVVVAGGGIAGVAAATVLAERGVQVTLVERERFLGGRAGAWTDQLSSGEPFEMERGFHAFFRQYYNLQALLRRVDTQLGFLQRLDDYPILGPQRQAQSFARLPRRTPQNVIALTLRSRALGLRDLVRIDKRRALEMLMFDMQRTYERWDGDTAANYLDSLRFPAEARRLLFDVFAHSFFNPETDMSAGELLMMFHFYFTGNPEGLVFDVAKQPFSHAIWTPFARYLETHSVALRLGESVRDVQKNDAATWTVVTDRGHVQCDAVVLALPVPCLQALVEQSSVLDQPGWRRAVARLRRTNAFAVWRLWLNGATAPGRAPFVGTTGLGVLDNISLYHLFEDESREWARRTGGSVVELHAYAVDQDASEEELRADMLRALHHLYPETAKHDVVEERFIIRQDCPAFAPGAHADRPEVTTPWPDVCLAGDFVKLPIPSALMERAAASGMLAANQLLAHRGVRPEPIFSVPARGLLAGLPFGRARTNGWRTNGSGSA